MSWLLDSDVLSQPAKKAGNARVAEQPSERINIPVLIENRIEV